MGLITELKGAKDRSRSVIAKRKEDQDKYVAQYQKLQEKFMELQENYSVLQQKYDLSLEMLHKARVETEVTTPEERKPCLRTCMTSARQTDRLVPDLQPKKPSDEVKSLRSMISHLSQSVRRMNESVYKPSPDAAVSLRIPSSSSPYCLNDTAQSGKSVQLQPLNLNILFEDPDHDEKVGKVLAKARQTKSTRRTRDRDQRYGVEFYEMVQEIEQSMAL